MVQCMTLIAIAWRLVSSKRTLCGDPLLISILETSVGLSSSRDVIVLL